MRSYTQFRTTLAQVMKKGHMGAASALRVYEKYIDDNKDKMHPQEVEGNRLSAQMEKVIVDGDALHLFLDSSHFAQWLAEKAKDDSDLFQLAGEVMHETFGEHGAMVLHFPCGSDRESFAVQTVLTDKGYGVFVHYGDDRNNEWFAGHLHALPPEMDDPHLHSVVNLYVGLGMYLSCFPEMVRDGVPDDLKKPSYHKYKQSMVVGTGAAIGGGVPVSAHYRRGHFRVLRSDVFKKKRWQVIWVRDSFVNGTAKTVETP